MQTDWTGKIVIVTGGAGGMGQAAARMFADAGAWTFVFGRTVSSLRETAKLSPRILPVCCDGLVGALSSGTGKEIADNCLSRSRKVSHGEREVLYETSDYGEPR